ncbi:MAG: serine hydrolase, partial [Phycisphaerales bacterium]
MSIAVAWIALAGLGVSLQQELPAPSPPPAVIQDAATTPDADHESWIDLFDGVSLNGWIRRG